MFVIDIVVNTKNINNCEKPKFFIVDGAVPLSTNGGKTTELSRCIKLSKNYDNRTNTKIK